jgi:outer membrane protein OmpA-like peptidoglycan-associated protein
MVIGFCTVNAQGLPDNPDPNKCYVRCVTPDVFITETVTVETHAAYTKLTVIPAQYENKTERVMVREGYTRYEIIPVEFAPEQVTFQSVAPYNKIAITPASFSDDSERIMVAPIVSRWEYSPYAGCKSDDPGDCQVLCWREYPAQFQDIPQRKLATDASFSASPAGATNDTYTLRKVSRVAEVREISVEPEFADITKRVLVKDETVKEEMVPAKTTTVTREVLQTKGGLESWAEIDCELLSYNALPINYELGSARITAESRSIIDNNLLKLMRENPNVRIELSSHTDSRGTAESNQSLSERRAQSVVNYLVSKGINKTRLVAVGYGESRLKNRCSDGVSCSESEHAANRRTEFRVLNN